MNRIRHNTEVNNGNRLPSIGGKSGSKVLTLVYAFSVSIGIFIGIHGLLSIPLMNPGTPLVSDWSVSDESGTEAINIPYDKPLSERKTITLQTSLPATEQESLIFTGLNATALTVTVDGKLVRIIGEHTNATANLWNSMIVVPLDNFPNTGRRLELKMTGHQTLNLSRIPTLEDRDAAVRRLSRHRFLYHDFVLFFTGACALLGTMLIGFSIPRRPIRWDGILLGISVLFVAVYASDFTFRYSTGTFFTYNILKRFIIASGYLATFSFFAGLDLQANKKMRLSLWMALPNLISILLIIFSPNVAILNQRLTWLNLILLTNMVMVVIVVIRKMRKRLLYVIAAGLIFLAIAQIIVIIVLVPGFPATLQYLVAVASILIGLQFLLDYRDVYVERENLRKVYDKDALTGAFNRRAMDSIDFREFDAAIFLDFDLFKSYNDTNGHDKGDTLLKDFVRVAHSQLRRSDLVIRFGGDEFLILLGEADEVLAGVIIERIREAFKSLVPGKKVDISYGIETVSEDGQLDMISLDKKMYTMKEQKRQD